MKYHEAITHELIIYELIIRSHIYICKNEKIDFIDRE